MGPDRSELLRALHDRIQSCLECQRQRGIEISKPDSMERGTADARILAIGAAPGRQAAEKQLAFAGHSFTRLYKTFVKAGFAGDQAALRREMYLTSVLKCAPPDQGARTRRQMSSLCLPFLGEQAEIIRPQFALILGKDAFDALAVKGTFAESVGRVRDGAALFGLLPAPGRIDRWMVMPHPSPLCRLWNDPEVVERTVESLRTLLQDL